MTGGEVEVSTSAKLPVREVFCDRPGVADFDVFEEVFGWLIRMIHHLGDDDRADLGAEVFEAEGVAGHGNQGSRAGTIGPATEGFAIEGGGEIDDINKAGWITRSVGFEKPERLSLRGAQAKGTSLGPAALRGVVVEEGGIDGEGVGAGDCDLPSVIVGSGAAIAFDSDSVARAEAVTVVGDGCWCGG